MPTEELLTTRLVLRRPRPEDVDGVLALLGDPRTVEHNPSDGVDTRESAGSLVARWTRHWEDHGFGYWCVFELGSSELGGICGIRRMTVRGHPVVNLLYRLRRELWGQGYATEAAAAVLARSGEQQPGQTILARVRPENVASQRVAAKLGLRRDAELDDRGDDGLDWAFTNR